MLDGGPQLSAWAKLDAGGHQNAPNTSGRRTKAAHRVNVDAKEHSFNRHVVGLLATFRQGIEPPVVVPLEQFARVLPLVRVLRFAEF